MIFVKREKELAAISTKLTNKESGTKQTKNKDILPTLSDKKSLGIVNSDFNRKEDRPTWRQRPSANFSKLVALMDSPSTRQMLEMKSFAHKNVATCAIATWGDESGKIVAAPAQNLYSNLMEMRSRTLVKQEEWVAPFGSKDLVSTACFHLFIGEANESVNLGTIQDMKEHGVGLVEATYLLSTLPKSPHNNQVARDLIFRIQEAGCYDLGRFIPKSFTEQKNSFPYFLKETKVENFIKDSKAFLLRELAIDDGNVLFRHILKDGDVNPFSEDNIDPESIFSYASTFECNENVKFIKTCFSESLNEVMQVPHHK